ncbi:MAG: ATP synthase F1 subunit delta [Holosporales bacterium]|nr:ATP synthase F1 subunit delta [Holosporales bacterium]
MERGERSYAQALLEVAEQRGAVKQIAQDFACLSAVLENVEIEGLWRKSLSSGEEGQLAQCLVETLPLSPLVADFLIFLGEHHLLICLGDLAHHFPSFLQEYTGQRAIIFSTAKDLSKAEREAVTNSLQSLLASEEKPCFSTDPSLISGFKIQVGSQVVDFSFKKHLEHLGDVLKGKAA